MNDPDFVEWAARASHESRYDAAMVVEHERDATGPGQPDRPTTVERALQILEWLAERENGRQSIRTIASATGLTKTTVHRVLESLARRGWVDQDTDGTYSLGSRALRVGSAVLRQIDAVTVIRPIAVRLRDETQETAFITVLDDDMLVIVDKFESPSPIRYARPVGSRGPVHANAAGKALVARLPEAELAAYLARPLAAATPRTITDPDALRRELALVRERGYGTADEESIEGVMSAGAAVIDHTGQAVAGLSVSGPRERFHCHLDAIIAGVVAAARDASWHLGAANLRSAASRALER